MFYEHTLLHQLMAALISTGSVSFFVKEIFSFERVNDPSQPMASFSILDFFIEIFFRFRMFSTHSIEYFPTQHVRRTDQFSNSNVTRSNNKMPLLLIIVARTPILRRMVAVEPGRRLVPVSVGPWTPPT